jgi:hypothetical protein
MLLAKGNFSTTVEAIFQSQLKSDSISGFFGKMCNGQQYVEQPTGRAHLFGIEASAQ